MTNLSIGLFVIIVFGILAACSAILNLWLIRKNSQLLLDNIKIDNKNKALFILLSSAMLNDHQAIFNDLFVYFNEAEVDKISTVLERYINNHNLKDHVANDICDRLKRNAATVYTWGYH